MAGRPSSKFEINLKQIEESLKKIETLSSHPSIRENLKLFSSKLVNLCSTFKETGTQTDDCTEDNRALTEDNILDDVLSLKDESMGFIMQNIWQNLKKDDRESFLYDFYKSQSKQDQCKFLESVGRTLNESVLQSSTKIHEKVNQLTFQNLCDISKQSLIDSCDERIISFFQSTTEKKYRQRSSNHDNTNEIANMVDNLYKARNANFVSPSGVRESLIVYLSSAKSVDCTQVISKQGGKGGRTVVDKIIKHSVTENCFSPPSNVSTFYSFDNIQTFFGSQRITGQGQVLAMVVTSILCTLPDGYKPDLIQYKPHLSPSSWFSQYQYNSKTKASNDKLDTDILLECASYNDDDQKLVESYFDKDLEEALKTVSNELGKPSKTQNKNIGDHLSQKITTSQNPFLAFPFQVKKGGGFLSHKGGGSEEV